MKGFILTDYLTVASWTNVAVEQVAGSETYINAASEAANVLNVAPSTQWGSPLVTPPNAVQQFDLTFTGGSASDVDTLAVIGLQVIGELVTRGDDTTWRRPLARKPVLHTSMPNWTSTDGTLDVPVSLYPYAVPQFSADNNEQAMALSWSGTTVRTFTAASFTSQRVRFRLDPKQQKHTVRIDRIMFGTRYTFPLNMQARWRMGSTNYSQFERTPGQFSFALTRRPSFRTAAVTFSPLQKPQMDTFDELLAACDSFVPMLWVFDPEDPQAWIYGVIVPSSYNKTFIQRGKYWELSLQIEELHH